MDKPQYIQINIPSPCTENWDKMTPCEQGRYCGHCNKTVIDFTSWSDAAVYDFFKKGGPQVCGRFFEAQLGRPLSIPPQPQSRLYRMMVAMGLTLIFAGSGEVYAQRNAPMIQSAAISPRRAGSMRDTMGGIKGRVVGTHDTLTGANVMLYAGSRLVSDTFADAEGLFEFGNLEPGVYRVLVRYVGYNTVSIPGIEVNRSATPPLTIPMTEAEMILGRTMEHPGVHGARGKSKRRAKRAR